MPRKRATFVVAEDLLEAIDAARRDPLFLRDLEEVERDFRLADAETARAIV